MLRQSSIFKQSDYLLSNNSKVDFLDNKDSTDHKAVYSLAKENTMLMLEYLRNNNFLQLETLAESSTNSFPLSPLDIPAIIISKPYDFTRALLLECLLTFPSVNINARDKSGATVLFNCEPFQVSLLLSTGIDIDAVDHNGDTALMRAVRYSYDELAYALMKHGASFNIANNNGDTVLHLLARKGLSRDNNKFLLSILEQPDIDFDREDSLGNTAYALFNHATASDFLKQKFPQPYRDILTKFKSKTRNSNLRVHLSRTNQWRLENIIKKFPSAPELKTMPADWFCPIGSCLMDNPVKISNGQIYDKKHLANVIGKIRLPLASNKPKRSAADIKASIELFLLNCEWKYRVSSKLAFMAVQTDLPRLGGIDIANDEFLKRHIAHALFINLEKNANRILIDFPIQNKLQDFFFDCMKELPHTRPYNFVSMFFMDPEASYAQRQDKFSEMKSHAIALLKRQIIAANPQLKAAIEELILATHATDHTSHANSSVLCALWQTVFVLQNPAHTKLYIATHQPLIGHPDHKIQRIALAVAVVGSVLLAGACLVALGTVALPMPAALAVALIITTNALGIGLFVAGMKLMFDNRRRSVAKAVHDIEKQMPSLPDDSSIRLRQR